ncbi:hypothetical protein GXM_01145 [Nostoc sphaeroides CCNUC1]|uniref:Uncharacterized protein n=1 Tax=Nostoc sphaeroides CCNUC1 TaxID=2653204 RepID=A0A5P8VTG5_9NOSO|nr:hypothetical protein GXM_01145 [Nostoc sphaeroides CCNUC1]
MFHQMQFWRKFGGAKPAVCPNFCNRSIGYPRNKLSILWGGHPARLNMGRVLA